ncbi:MAG: hypothetical protein M3336_04840, partial [Chloroflexota bacterium]|nr:hypothetical protein [Chloroflexota bacterium]
MRIMRWLAATVGAACLLPAQVTGQSAQRLSVQASGLYAALFGAAYENLNAGPGFEAQLRFTPSALSLGVGYQYTDHDFQVFPATVT